MIHEDLKNSGLTEKFNIGGDNGLSDWVGKTVHYKREKVNDPNFLRAHGTIILTETFLIRATQKDHAGIPSLRGYYNGDTFGRCINVNDVEEV